MFLTQQKNDSRNLAASCAEACPVPGGELRNCTPPEVDGSASISLCSWAGRIEPCGGQQFCCPAPGGQWTTNMSACIAPTATPTLSPTPTITSTPTLTPTREPTATPEPTSTPDPTEIPTATNTRAPTATRTPTGTRIPTNTPTGTRTPTQTPTRVPTATLIPTPTTGLTAPFLNFRMSFLGVATNSLCADGDKMPLSVTVIAKDGISQTYNNILPTLETATAGSSWATYKVGVRLQGFEYRNNLTVLVKGPKHLQIKYGRDGQNKFYNSPGGELMGLTNNPASSPTFNFTNYPALAGDVTGVNSGVPDGVIDGLDFSFIKNEAVKRTTVATHSYMQADTNGNCEMESSDLAWMMLALVDKQEQVY